jgi:N-acetylglutamate synthase
VDPAIAELEQVAALGWRATEEERLGGWLLRAADGVTGRANSALAVGDPGLPLGAALGVVRRWYEARQLPPMINVARPLAGADRRGLDIFLDGLGWGIRPGPAVVMIAKVTQVARHGSHGGAGSAVDPELTLEPDDGWLSIYNHRRSPLPPTARRLLLSAPEQVFATIRDSGQPVAIGRLAIAAGWGGLTAIEVHPDHRRRGLGARITAALSAAAAQRGATRVYLQVEERNTAAVALYSRCGFASHHRYHYRVAPRAAA